MATSKHYQVRQIKVLTVFEDVLPVAKLDFPKAVFEFWNQRIAGLDWYDSEKESLVAFNLDSKLVLKSFHLVTMGIVNQTLCHAREVFRPAIVAAAVHVIVAHNHPSGDSKPSPDDVRSYLELQKAGELLGIPMLDSIVVGKTSTSNPKGYHRLKESGF